MNNSLKIFIFLLCITALSSCFNNANKGEKEATKEDVNISIDNKVNENKETKFDSEKNTLTIWDKVEIKNWIENSFPKDIKIYKDNKTYVNSNVPNYIFFISDKNDKVSTISTFYKNLFKKLWYKDLSKIQEKQDLESYQNLEFILENPKYKEFKPEDLNIPNHIISNEPKYLQKILIKINNTVPDNIKENMWLDWFFVEIYYNQF